MQSITTIGLDIAKSVFQVHGVDAEGRVIDCLADRLSVSSVVLMPLVRGVDPSQGDQARMIRCPA